MSLPNFESLLSDFSAFLFEAKLSNVSVKNYLSDLRHFVRYCSESFPGLHPTQIIQSISKYHNSYIQQQRSSLTPAATLNRRLASLRRFETFLKSKQIVEIDQNASLPSDRPISFNSTIDLLNKDFTTKKLLDLFKNSLIKEKKTHSTVKNYLSDLYHYFDWIAKETPYTTQNIDLILSQTELNAYTAYLKLTKTSDSVISRRASSIKKITLFCTKEKYLANNPFEKKYENVKISPITWFRRYLPKASKPSNTPKTFSSNKSVIAARQLYDKYHNLPFTPYLHLAILVLATTVMAFLGYNQIIKQAKPSSAATALTPPKRQLSFQGRLTDTSGTPITTAVNVTFKLWNDPDAGSQLYTSNICSITPDPDGVFNTLIGDGVCGSEISQAVFADNRDVYLELTVGSETLDPRQQIATVGYALNSETLQGYPASAAATINTVPVIDNNGDINIAVTNPSLVSTSGTFNINGQALSLTTATNSGGDIILQPDALGSGQILAIGGTTTEDTFRITNANLSTGSLISGYIGNDTATGSGNLILLSSGATESAKFWVTADGRTNIHTATNSAETSALIINQNGAGDIFSASSSGITQFTIDNLGDIYSNGDITISGGNINTGNISFTLGDITTDNINLITDGTGNGEVVLPDDAIGPNEIFSANQTDEYCLTYEATGTTWEWQTCGSGGGGSNWTVANGTISPNNSTLDFFIGGQSTSSAKFAFLNVDSGTPTASISGNIFIDGNGNLSTTNRRSLVLGNSATYDSTGDILLNPNGGKVGIGKTNPQYALDVEGNLYISQYATISASMAIGNTSAAAGFGNLNMSGNLTVAGDTTLNGETYTWPSSTGGTGSILTTDLTGNLSWADPSGTGTIGFWTRAETNPSYPTIYPTNDETVTIGFGNATPTDLQAALEVLGNISPHTDEGGNLGDANNNWNDLYLTNDINNDGGIAVISIADQTLKNGHWIVSNTLGIGTTEAPGTNTLVVGGNATISGNLATGGNIEVNKGTGKIDVGTVDPPYTINGEKYATYMSGMVGVKEEVTGQTNTLDYIENIGYRTLIDLKQQPKGSDLWLFGKTTNIKNNINQLTILLTGEGQTKTWYEIDRENKVIALYSSSPTRISYRFTAPRFDSNEWKNTREDSGVTGFILTDPDSPGSGNQFNTTSTQDLVAQLDGSYQILQNNEKEIKEVSSFKSSLIANLKAGSAVIVDLFVDNLTIRQKLITPIADIDSLKANNATISGTLYANNIKGQTVDKLNTQIDLLNEKYATASAILADLQNKYSSYLALSTNNSASATDSADPLSLSPLATTPANPSELGLETITMNESIFTTSLSSFDSDLYIQPTGDKPIHLLANLMTLYPDGKVLINGDLLVTGTIYANNLDTKTATISGSLALGKGEIATDSGKLISLFNEIGEVVGSVDNSGSAHFDEIVTPELIIASGNSTASNSADTYSNASIGIGSIATNSAEIFIQNTKINSNTLIYITPISDTNNQVLFVKSKQNNIGFTVATNQPVTNEILFNYWIVQTK